MSALNHKIDFVALVSVTMANSNGDPLNGNRPRTDYNGFGEISDVCVKRKIRNRMQDLGANIFVQEESRAKDECNSLSERAKETLKLKTPKNIKEKKVYVEKACETWLDVRSFGQVFAFKNKSNKDKNYEQQEEDQNGVSCGVRGPVSIHQAISVSPVEIESMQITKSVNGDQQGEKAMASDRMGMKHFVRFGLYKIKGSINPQLAEKTGFSYEDAQIIKKCLQTLFVNDASAARPDGSMEVVELFWWEHNCKDGQYSSARVHRSVKVTPKSEDTIPSCVEDYDISVEPLDGLQVERLKEN